MSSLESPTQGEIDQIQKQLDQKNYSAAEKLANHLIKNYPDSGIAWWSLGVALFRQSRFDLSSNATQKALHLEPMDPRVHLLIAQQCIGTGNIDQATRHLRQAIEINPNIPEIYYVLATIHRFTANDPILGILEQLYKNNTKYPRDPLLLYSLAKAYKDIGNNKRYLEFIILCNQTKRELYPYNPEDMNSAIRTIKYKDKISPDCHVKKPGSRTTPIFILGMPRSGTTLLEQILSSHPSIGAGGELNFLSTAYKKYCGLSDFSVKSATLTRRFYFDNLKKISGDKPFIIDKNPFNFLFIGLIKRAIPEAKIIHIFRNSEDVCWSNYSTNFSEDSVSYSNDIFDTVAYYNAFIEIMEYWYKTYSDIYTIKYESIVENIEKQTTSLLSYIGLPWSPACLDFQNNPNTVRTASINQVRRPLKNSNGAWKKFEHFLKEPFSQLRLNQFKNSM